MRIVALLTAILVATATPLLANGQGYGVQECHAYANSLAYTGAKSYSAQYTAAYQACMDQRADYAAAQPNFRQPRGHNVTVGYCPPNAPFMYRGTLYCRN
ncbi:hypothetical protein [Tropicibacter alexandrii]|uniref:hypothetical protein n=1 Tax=Tropicibacter alexandrii TaxID=2267683 RepID=UPI000EF4B80A|nr:hypothetical protein [Tropicibacter alexandrii]